VEVYELVIHATPVKAATFAVNIIVVIYLVRKKRLFSLDEPAAER